MTIAAGTQLGSYEVVAPIGAGGMGEVYQAHDTKLGRDVAIKVLPEAFAHDPERLSRFQREAKMLAALNHPNIGTIYGLEQANGTSYLVMELVPGETLADCVKREGALPVEEALAICKQIAEALEAAHEKGIIHRDLKPANVKVTPEGKVKVLDFGLAKAFAGDTANDDPSNSPTLSMAATMHGLILGTAAYMSPEQARGKVVDKRTDIWAFGCVLYELLCGRPAFEGEDVTEILTAVVKTEPDWNRLPESTSPSIRVLLRRCVRKDRRQRLQDAADVRIEIEDALSAPSVGTTAEVPATGGWRRPIPLGLAALAAVAVAMATGAAGWFLKPSRSQTAQTIMRFTLSLPPSERLPAGVDNNLAFSPDGTHVAYAALREDGSWQLYLQDVGGPQAKPITGTERSAVPVFSPDGQWLAYVADHKLKKTAIAGGEPLTVCDLQNSRGLSWGPTDTIVFTDIANPGIWQVSAAGGSPKLLVAEDTGNGGRFFWPELLPGGRAVLFAVGDAFDWGDEEIVVQELGTGKRRVLVEGGTYPRYLPGGYLLYLRAGTLMAAPFDLTSLQLTGTAVPVFEGIGQSLSSGAAYYSVTGNGSLAYVPAGSRQQERALLWEDRKGGVQPVGAPPGAYIFPNLSPDGRGVAVTVQSARSQIWLYDTSSEKFARLTFGGGSNQYPVWTPDGSRIVYESFREGSEGLFWKHADGTGAEEPLIARSSRLYPNSFSSDGRMLAFTEVDPKTGYDIWVLPLQGERKPRPFLQTPAFEGGAMFSPDGRWLAYTSDESGRYEVYVQPYPGPGGKWQVSTEGGQQPRWARDGRELFYLASDQQKVMAVEVTTQLTFSASRPRLISQTQGFGTIAPPLQSNYDVAPDGRRFLRIKTAEWVQLPTQINVVLNWFEELKQKVPPGKK